MKKLLFVCLALALCACVATTSDLARVTKQLEASQKANGEVVARFEARMAEIADLYESGQASGAQVADAIRDQSKTVSEAMRQTAARDVAVAQSVTDNRTQQGLGWWDLAVVVVLGHAGAEYLRRQFPRKVA